MSPLWPAVPALDNSLTRGDLVALRTLAERHIIVVTLRPRLTHVKQPVDVCWARAFKTSYRRFLWRLIDEDSLVKAYAQLGVAARNGARTVARDSRERRSLTCSTLAPES